MLKLGGFPKEVTKMRSKCKNIIVEDYLYSGNYIFGTFYEIRKDREGNEEVFYILDDGDVYSEKNLKDSGYKYTFLDSEDIIEAFKKRFDEVEIEKCNIKKMFECPKCRCYNEDYKCIICGTILNPSHLKILIKEEDINSILQKAREELKKKEIEIKTNDKKNGWIKVNLVSDIEKVI